MKILIIFALYILSPSLYANAADIQGKVIRVLDGDTIEILQNKTPVRIRLANIDAPEKKQPKKVQYIENPLPLPKKHIKRVMDYSLKEMPDEDDFDLDIGDEDDFDY